MTNKKIQAVTLSKKLKQDKPLKVYFEKKAIVLIRVKGKISAFLDICPHRGLPLSSGQIKNNHLNCCYHGWSFDQHGYLVDIPGDNQFNPTKTCLLTKYYALEKSGIIWLSKKKFNENEILLPSVQNSTYQFISTIKTINANKLNIAENFLDALHTHTIHTGIIRSAKPSHHCVVNISNIENGYQAEYIEDKKQTGLLSQLFGRKIIKSIGRIQYPNVVEIQYLSEKTIEMSVVIYIIEKEDNACELIIRTYLKKTKTPFYLKVACLAPLQLLAFWQDKKILEKQKKTLYLHPNFKPIIKRTDIMRPYIEKTYNEEFIECNKQVEIML